MIRSGVGFALCATVLLCTMVFVPEGYCKSIETTTRDDQIDKVRSGSTEVGDNKTLATLSSSFSLTSATISTSSITTPTTPTPPTPTTLSSSTTTTTPDEPTTSAYYPSTVRGTRGTTSLSTPATSKLMSAKHFTTSTTSPTTTQQTTALITSHPPTTTTTTTTTTTAAPTTVPPSTTTTAPTTTTSEAKLEWGFTSSPIDMFDGTTAPPLSSPSPVDREGEFEYRVLLELRQLRDRNTAEWALLTALAVVVGVVVTSLVVMAATSLRCRMTWCRRFKLRRAVHFSHDQEEYKHLKTESDSEDQE